VLHVLFTKWLEFVEDFFHTVYIIDLLLQENSTSYFVSQVPNLSKASVVDLCSKKKKKKKKKKKYIYIYMYKELKMIARKDMHQLDYLS
jgi:hypothetical protein